MCSLLHLNPVLHVYSVQACGKVNNVCCFVLISQQSLLFLFSSSLIVFPHYEMY